MKRLSLLIAFCLATLVSGIEASSIQWMTNYDQALQAGKQSSKPLVLLFTGSDWCTWCIKLEKESLDTSEFADAAGDKFIFVKLDFPRSTLSNVGTSSQNNALRERFKVMGFPTVVIVDPVADKKIASTGYKAGGGRQYAQHLLNLAGQR